MKVIVRLPEKLRARFPVAEVDRHLICFHGVALAELAVALTPLQGDQSKRKPKDYYQKEQPARVSLERRLLNRERLDPGVRLIRRSSVRTKRFLGGRWNIHR